MVISVEDFVQYMKHIQDQLDKDDKLTDLIVCEDTNGWVSTAPYLIDDMVDLISQNLKDDNEWLAWWLWEIDEDKENNKVWSDWEGKSYKFTIQDTEDLYYLITDDLGKIKEKVEEEAPDCTICPTVEHPNFTGDTLYDVFMAQMNGYTESDN